MKSDIEQFEKAFSMHISGPTAECQCGKVYVDTYNDGYDWEDGEEERLLKNGAIGVRHGVERICLEGVIYCMDCTCWHARAERIVAWMRDHQQQIGEWFRLEKQRLLNAAKEVPEVQHG